MTVEEIKKQAYSGDTADIINYAEKLLYMQLKDIYADFRLEKIGKAEGERRKAKALSDYAEMQKEAEMQTKYAMRNADLWREIESAAIAYAKSGNHTPEADALMEAVYGVKMRWDI